MKETLLYLTENSTDICILNFERKYLTENSFVIIRKMESKRQKQVAKQIQRDLSEIFQREMKQTFDGAFITITDVKLTPDLAMAKIYMSFLLTNDKEGVLQIIRENTKVIRNFLGERVRHQLRIVPSLQFFIDDTAEYAQKIDALFASIVIPPDPDAEDNNQ